MKTRRSWWRAGAAVAVTGSLVLTACGSDGEKSPDGEKPTVTVQVIKDARAKPMAEMPWTKGLEEACGCTITWQETAASSWQQQKQASLAAGEITKGNTWRSIRKELAVGVLNGGTFLIAGACLALIWYQEPALAGVFGAALLINLVVAAVLGATIPIALHRLGQDPAVASSVFLTPVTDAVGFFAFLGLASLFLL